MCSRGEEGTKLTILESDFARSGHSRTVATMAGQ